MNDSLENVDKTSLLNKHKYVNYIKSFLSKYRY
jgi:hypothetical protein